MDQSELPVWQWHLRQRPQPWRLVAADMAAVAADMVVVAVADFMVGASAEVGFTGAARISQAEVLGAADLATAGTAEGTAAMVDTVAMVAMVDTATMDMATMDTDQAL